MKFERIFFCHVNFLLKSRRFLLMESKDFEFGLSINNLRNIPFHMYTNDFTFHVNNKSYKTNRFVADLLSPYICRLHFSDQSINEYTIKYKPLEQTNDDDDSFQQFLKLATFEKVKINTKLQQRFRDYFKLLGNVEDFFNIQPGYFNDLTEDNAIDRLLALTNFYNETSIQLSFEDNQNIDKIIDFISGHFDSFDKEKLKQFDTPILERIVGNQKIKLKEEDSLLKFILNLYQKDERAAPLFQYVIFRNVSEDGLREFIEKFDIENIDHEIWRSICEQILHSKQSKLKVEGRYEKCFTSFEYEEGKELNGILHYLVNKTGGNIHDNGTVEITSNSISGDNHPKNLVDYQNEKNRYHSLDDGKAFICFDFKEKTVNLTSYQIKSNWNGDGSFNPKNWVIEVSNDGKEYKEIDRHDNDLSLNKMSVVSTYKVQKQSSVFYRFIRFRQTGEGTYRNDNRFWFVSIEFYGRLDFQDNSK